MTIDPDILQIRRKRRQEGDCLKCGVSIVRRNGRPPVLCDRCIAAWAYCPNCEVLFERRPALNPRHATEYCPECNMLNKRISAGKRPYDRYLEDIQARRHEMLPDIIRRYKRGQNMTEAAIALGITRTQIDTLIRDARVRGEWPDELRRRRW